MPSSLVTGCEVTMVSHRTSHARRDSMKSLVTPTRLAISLAGGSRGTRRYGNLTLRCYFVLPTNLREVSQCTIIITDGLL